MAFLGYKTTVSFDMQRGERNTQVKKTKYQHNLHFNESLKKSSTCICMRSSKKDNPTKEDQMLASTTPVLFLYPTKH